MPVWTVTKQTDKVSQYRSPISSLSKLQNPLGRCRWTNDILSYHLNTTLRSIIPFNPSCKDKCNTHMRMCDAVRSQQTQNVTFTLRKRGVYYKRVKTILKFRSQFLLNFNLKFLNISKIYLVHLNGSHFKDVDINLFTQRNTLYLYLVIKNYITLFYERRRHRNGKSFHEILVVFPECFNITTAKPLRLLGYVCLFISNKYEFKKSQRKQFNWIGNCGRLERAEGWNG